RRATPSASSNALAASGYFFAWYALLPASVSSFHFAPSSSRSSAVSFFGGSSAAPHHSPAAIATNKIPAAARVMTPSLAARGAEHPFAPPRITPPGRPQT